MSHIHCPLVDGQCNGKSSLSVVQPMPSCDKQSAHLEICHKLCITSINQKPHIMVKRQGLDLLLICRNGHLPL